MRDKTTVEPVETYLEKVFREFDESLLAGYVPLGIKKTRKQKQRVAKAAAMKEASVKAFIKLRQEQGDTK